MARLPDIIDPTLAAIDAALVAGRAKRSRASLSLGASSIGKPCARQLWYAFRWATRGGGMDAAGVRRVEDGDRGERVMAARLRLVNGIELWATDPATGRQYGAAWLGGHLKCYVDGVILGLIQAPKTPHVWEHKCVSEKRWRELAQLKAKHGEDAALQAWDDAYWAQAMLGMYGLGLDRHYLTVDTPGGRESQSVRTRLDEAAAEHLVRKAEEIVFSDRAPPRYSDDPDFWLCRFCNHRGACHGRDFAASNCRTCLHGEVRGEGGWRCALHERVLTPPEQEAGCGTHLFLPDAVPGEVVEASEGERRITYRLRDGKEWSDVA